MGRTVSSLEQAWLDANGRLREVEREIGNALANVKHQIAEDFKDKLRTVRAACVEAEAALNEELVNNSTNNPLVGRRVVFPARPATFGSRHRPERNGLVEVWNRTSLSNTNHNPRSGDLVVRVLKKDGSPSTVYRWMTAGELPYGWCLMDLGA